MVKKRAERKSGSFLEYIYTLENILEVVVNQDTSAVLANDNFLSLLDVQLTLRWNLVKATSTSITGNSNYSKSVAGILADTLECCQKTLFDTGFDLL